MGEKEDFLKGDTFATTDFETLLDTATKLRCITDFKNIYRRMFPSFNILDFGENAPVQMLRGGEYKIEDENGVKCIKNYNGKIVCLGLIQPVSIYENINSGKEMIQIAYLKDNKWMKKLLPQEKIAASNKLTELANYGIPVSSTTAPMLSKYLIDLIALNRKELSHGESTDKLGWCGDNFIPYNGEVIFDGEECFKKSFESIRNSGDFDKWCECMGYVRENLPVRLLMAASFASPLLKILKKKPFVVLVWGTTGDGKTVAGMCAMSIWGNPSEGNLQFSMNNTANYYYRIAQFMNNIPCFFDELQTFRGDLDALIMGLSEGMDRGRAKADGGVESLKTWQNTFILTGEQTASTVNSGGGTLNRLIEINTSGRIIEQGSRVARIVTENYGFAGKRFIDFVSTLKRSEIEKRFDENLELLLKCTSTAEKQAQNMAVLMTADDIARECIFPIEEKLNPLLLREYMFSKDEIDISERAWQYVFNEFSNNIVNFTENGRENWGRLTMNNFELDVNKNVIDKILMHAKFNPNKIYKDWAESGKLIKSNNNKTASHRSIDGVKAYYIHLKMQLKEENK